MSLLTIQQVFDRYGGRRIGNTSRSSESLDRDDDRRNQHVRQMGKNICVEPTPVVEPKVAMESDGRESEHLMATASQHRAIYQAMRAGQARAAEELLRAHISDGGRRMLAGSKQAEAHSPQR